MKLGGGFKMKKIMMLIVTVLFSIVSWHEAKAFVTPEKLPTDIFNHRFLIDVDAEHLLNKAVESNAEVYISIFDLDGTFLGGNYSSKLAASYDANVMLEPNTDYIAKVEGEQVRTQYIVFNTDEHDGWYRKAIYLHLMPSVSTLDIKVLGATKNYKIMKDGRVVREGVIRESVIDGNGFTVGLEAGNYTIHFDNGEIRPLTVGESHIKELSYQFTEAPGKIMYRTNLLTSGVMILDEQGTEIDTIYEMYVEGYLNPGTYTFVLGDDRQSFVIDEGVQVQRTINFSKLDITEKADAEPAVKVRSTDFRSPAHLTIQDASGKTVLTRTNYLEQNLLLEPGVYTAIVKKEGYYDGKVTFTYNGYYEEIEVNVPLVKNEELITVHLLNGSNVNVSSAQMEIINHATNEKSYVTKNDGFMNKWSSQDLEPGTYTVRFLAANAKTFEQEVVIAQAEKIEIPIYLHESHPWYDRFEDFSPTTVVPHDKVWTITFSAPVRPNRVNSDVVYVTDGNGIRLHNIELSLSADGKAITVTNKSPYLSKGKYRLYVSSLLQSEAGERLDRDTVKTFIIE